MLKWCTELASNVETVISAQPVKLQRDKFQRAMCKKIDNMDKWKSRHLIAFLAIGRTRFFPSCEKLIPSKTLKLSAAVHSHFKDILKYEKYEKFLCFNSNRKLNYLFLSSSLCQIAEIFQCSHFIRFLALLCINFRYFLNF